MTVSVVIPAYNAERWLSRAVRSVQAQEDCKVSQIVIIDDASRDGTARTIRALSAQEPRITALANANNLGPAASRNRGLAAATGEWIALLDADDAFAPVRLARLLEAARTEDVRIIADLPVLYDLAADRPAPRQPPSSRGMDRLIVQSFLAPDPETKIDLGLLKPVFHRSLVEDGLWTYPEAIRHAEDFALYLDLVRKGVEFALLREAHYIFSTRIGAISGRFSPGSVTAVDYHAVADQAARLLDDMQQTGDITPEIKRLLDERIRAARRANRLYGWTVLRKGELRRLAAWLKASRNRRDFARVLGQKITGKRGLPD